MIKKIVIAILFVIILFGGVNFFATKKKNQTTEKSVSNALLPIITVSQKSADQDAISVAIISFYQKYDNCMKNPPSQAEGQVSVCCQNNSGLTTATFASNLDKGSTAKAGADPIYCAQFPAESVSVNPDIKITGKQAVAQVSAKFGDMNVNTIHINLLKENGTWKIDNILCSRPS